MTHFLLALSDEMTHIVFMDWRSSQSKNGVETMAKYCEEAPKAAQQSKARDSSYQAFKEMQKTFRMMNAFDTPEAQAAEAAWEKFNEAFTAFRNSEFSRQQTNNED
jgi:hypothetical protein